MIKKTPRSKNYFSYQPQLSDSPPLVACLLNLVLGSLGLTLGMLSLLSRSLSREVVRVAPACEEIEEVASLPVDPTLVRGLSSVARLYVMGDGWMDSWLVARRDSWEEVLPKASLQGSLWESELLETAWLLSSPVSEEELWR